MDTDVLVVGAGPTGLMLSNQLIRHGVRPLVIDRHAGPVRETRALGVQARTLEIYDRLGIAALALELGKQATGANMWARGRRAVRVPLGDIGRDMSPFPFLLILGQDDNERLLGEVLRTSGARVQWNTELVSLTQEANRVRAGIRAPDGSFREITASWVAGCDGARSIVREQSGIAFEGAPYEHVFYVADVHVVGPMVPDELNIYLWPDGFHLLFPMRGQDHWRVAGILPEGMRDRKDLTFAHLVPSVQREAGELTFHSCSWFSTYRIHHRRATRFRDRRCFLLGDAAHIHSPVGAQGMNTGLQDAYNLAWKLALVVSGGARAALLDSYEDERIPVAERLLNSTDRAFTMIVSDKKLKGLLRTWLLPRVLATAMHTERFRRLAFRTISQIGIAYPDSRLSQNLAAVKKAAPRAGDRFPWIRVQFAPNAAAADLFGNLDDTRFNLVAIGQEVPAAGVPGLEDRLRVHEVPVTPENDRELARAGIPRPSFYLLRPDGHVGLAGANLDVAAATRYLAERLHIHGG